MSRRVSVHNFVVTELTRPRSPIWRASDLFGASHWVDVPADTEFPYRLPRMHVFTRFYLKRARPTDFRVRVRWLDSPDGMPRVIGVFGPFSLPFTRDAVVWDCSFGLNNIRLEGAGLHRVELLRERRRRWGPSDEVRSATTYFAVER